MIERFIEELKRRHPKAIAHIKRLPELPPIGGEPSPPLPDSLTAYLSLRDLRLYRHQAEAIERVGAGEHIMLTTPTASGKTLAFNLAVLEGLHRDPNATALYLYPLKALTRDQLSVLKELEAGTGIEIRPDVYDGDTPQHLRPRIRERSRVVLTNPHALHQYLPWHHKWRRFFGNLRYVVIDEAHTYRGVFGSNVAMVLRRMRRIAERFGAEPQFILSSATIANPAEHGQRLAGVDFEIISESGAPQGEKFLLFWNSLGSPHHSVHRQTSELLADHVREGLQTLCFTVSRKLAEIVARWVRQQGLEGEVTSYRAGYPPEERREIEQALKSGKLRGVASTTALELGIDIGGLDAVIISGYPGTVLSTWQMAGRAGRRGRPSLVTLIGFGNPLDQYFMKHPDQFCEKPHEHAIIDLENPHISLGHAMCAAAELPLITERDVCYFGPHLRETVRSLERQKLVQKTPTGYVYRGRARPVEAVTLEHISERAVHVLADGEHLETLELRRAYEEAHPGAVLLHRGETYIVQGLDLEAGVAHATKEDVEFYTDALRDIDVGVRRETLKRETRWGALHLGEVNVVERVVGYRVRKYDRTLGLHGLDLPPLAFTTTALWLTLGRDSRERVEGAGLDWAGGLHAVEHAMIAMTPFHALCDRWDIGGLSTPLHPDTGESTVFIYDGIPGGIGIAEKACELFEELARTTYELIRDCACEDGCPSCIYSPKCGNHNEPLDKGAALSILSELIGDLNRVS